MKKSLREWEADLAPQLKQVELLGELDLTMKLLNELGQLIGRMASRERPGQAIELLERNYPVSLAVYLVAQGTHGYEGGTYWPKVQNMTGIPTTYGSRLGQFFERFLEEHGLPLFTELDGLRYVSRILLHGGIPDYCLSDFFTNLLYPALRNNGGMAYDAEELILEWLDSPMRANEPVRRFVLYGGQIGENFVTRCLTMAQRLTMTQFDDQKDRVKTANEIGLPRRVIEKYRQWVKGRENTATLSAGLRLRRPHLLLEPWQGEGIDVELPTQLLPKRPQQGACWVVTTDHESFTQPLYAEQRANGWETEEAWVLLQEPSSKCTVLFDNGEGIRRRWEFSLLSPDKPLMVFDPDTGQLLTWNRYLPARSLWLLYPSEMELEVHGGKQLEVFERLPGSWYDYRIEHWELTRAKHLVLGEQTIPIQQDAASLRPRLSGGRTLTLLRHDDDPILYVGQPPEIVIPLSPQREAESELQRWQISILDSFGNCRYRGLLDEQKSTLRKSPEAWHLSLEQLLDPFGTFEIHLRGPLGRDTRFLLALVPALRICGHDHVRLVGSNNALPDAHFMLKTAPDLQLSCADPNILISHTSHFYRIQAPASYSKADLYLTKVSDEQNIQVGFCVPLPMLRWRVVDSHHVGEWSVTPLAQSVAWFDQADSPSLQLMVTPHISTMETLSGQLQVTYQRHEPAQLLNSRGKNKKLLTFNLKEAADSIRSSDEPSIRFELLQHQSDSQKPDTRTNTVTLLSLTQALQLEQFELDHCLVDDQWYFLLEWEGNFLHNRYVRFWPLYRPWEAPIDFPIPDGAGKEHGWTEPISQLAPGAYRAEMTVIEPDSSAQKPRPTADTPNTIDLKLGDDKMIGHYLRNRTNDVPTLLEKVLASPNESACYYALKALKERLSPQYITHGLSTLIALSEHKTMKSAILTGESRISTLFRHILLKYPIDFLKTVVYQWQEHLHTAEKLELALWLLDAKMARLFRSVQQFGYVIREDLLSVMRLSANDLESLVDLESFLKEAGIEVREKSKIDKPADSILRHEQARAEWFDNILQLYLYEIGSVELLTAEEEQRLAARYQEGREAAKNLWQLASLQSIHADLLQDRLDQAYEARHQFIIANQRLVVSIAKRYRRRLPLLDLIQEGNLGLMRAVQKFDPKRGYKFSTYASWWIRQSISRAEADYGRTIRVPIHITEQINKATHASHDLIQQLGREPTAEEMVLKSDKWLPAKKREKILKAKSQSSQLNPSLSQELKEATYKVKRLRLLNQPLTSLDVPIGDQNGSTLSDLIPDKQNQGPEEETQQRFFRDDVKKLLKVLTSRQEQILTLRYGLQDGRERTLEEVGTHFGLTRERIRQIEKKALEKLKQTIVRQVRTFGFSSVIS